MSTKHHLSSAQELYVGAGYDARLFGTNARRGVPVHLLTRVSLGSPIALDADGLIVGATSTELPNNGTITYTTAEDGASPIDNAATPAPSTITTSTGATASVWALDVPRNITATSTTAVADTVFTITGYDYWKVKVVEQFTIAAAASAGAGKKAFAYIESIAIYSAGDITTDTVTVGWGDVLGPAVQVDLEGRRGTGVLQRCAGRFGHGCQRPTRPTRPPPPRAMSVAPWIPTPRRTGALSWCGCTSRILSTPEGLQGCGSQYGG